MFIPGTQVICINGRFPKAQRLCSALPKKGKVYTVRDEMKVVVYLDDFEGPVNRHNIELGFGVEHFKPVIQ